MLRGEATARFFPATGGAPLVSIVHPIDLATLTTRSLTPNVILNEKVTFRVTTKLTYIEKIEAKNYVGGKKEYPIWK